MSVCTQACLEPEGCKAALFRDVLGHKSLFEIESQVAQAGFELAVYLRMTLNLYPLEWHCKHVHHHDHFLLVLVMEPSTSCMLGKHSN